MQACVRLHRCRTHTDMQANRRRAADCKGAGEQRVVPWFVDPCRAWYYVDIKSACSVGAGGEGEVMQRDGSPGRKAGSSLRSPLCALGKRMHPVTLPPRSACAKGGRSASARGANFSSKAALRTQTGRTKGDIAGRISKRGGAPRNNARLAEGPQEPACTGRTAPCAEDSWAEYAVCSQQGARDCGCRRWHTRAQRAHRCATPHLCVPLRCEVPVHSVRRAAPAKGAAGSPATLA